MYALKFDSINLELKVPSHLVESRFRLGFSHALEGGQLNKIEQFKLSFNARNHRLCR
ncbi:MAG: hypothetical protein ACE5EH_06440 [Gammaproteobacteria bacterium]